MGVELHKSVVASCDSHHTWIIAVSHTEQDSTANKQFP